MNNITEKKDSLISVIVPAYNLEEYIGRAIKSILEQTYPFIEIIVVDDGSTDKTLEKVRTIASLKKQVKVYHQKNKGVTAARLLGISKASGEWIGFVDGDDEVERNMYKRLLDNAYRYHAEISHCGYQMVFSDGRIYYFYNTGRIVEQNHEEGLKDLLNGSFVEPGLWNKLFHKSLFHNLLHHRIMPLDIRINEDLLMNYYLFSESNHSVFEDICPYHYQVRNTSAIRSGVNSQRFLDPVRVRKIIFENCEPEIKFCAEAALERAYIYMYGALSLQKNDGNNKANISKLKKRTRAAINKHWIAVHVQTKHVQWMAYAIRYLPFLFDEMYRIFNKIRKKNVYD